MQAQTTSPTLNETPASIVQATAHSLPSVPDVLDKARGFVQPLLESMTLPTGENTFTHAEGVAHILRGIGAANSLQAAAYLIYAAEHLNKPQEIIEQAFGAEYAFLAFESMRLMQLQRNQRVQQASIANDDQSGQIEVVRKMLLAFSRDLRVILLRLASRLQTLRHYAQEKIAVPQSLAYESLHVLAPLANRLGIWQIKWELEDLAFRFLEPETYKQIATWLDEKRGIREQRAHQLRSHVQTQLAQMHIQADVQARPKHIYSIAKKMRGKSLDFQQIYDIMALRIIVDDVKACYSVLSWVHSYFEPLSSEYDDYIARPKPNGYQSLHTVVLQKTDDNNQRPIEIQIRSHAMHQNAELGVAAHWAYKEAGNKGYAGHKATGNYEAKIAVLRQLLAWERDFSDPNTQAQEKQGLLQDKIYVLTPDAAIIEIPQGATPVDFAYSVHTSLGHRCRGAKVDGHMVPLNTPLHNGQTVEITATKEGGPSRDWLNPELGYLTSNRARSKVRAWFNHQATQSTIARGRESIEKLLQRTGKTALKHDELAHQLGFSNADALFEVVGKDEFSLRNIEAFIRPAQEEKLSDDEYLQRKQSQMQERHARSKAKNNVLVVGMDSLMTQLAKCCKPAPPDAIGGFVTRGKGVSVHRMNCSNYRNMLRNTPERAIDVQWPSQTSKNGGDYSVDILLHIANKSGVLRDITDLLAREKIAITGMQSGNSKHSNHITLTTQVSDAERLQYILKALQKLPGVVWARRK